MGDNNNIRIYTSLDVTQDICPITFVKTKLELERMEKGQILEVILNDGEPIQNVPRSVKNEGHKIIAVEKVGDKFRLLIERGE